MSGAGVRVGHGFFEGLGRMRLHYRTWEVPEAEAALVVVHGLWEHGRRYQEFAEVMAGYGFSTYVMDLRGHGASGGRRGHVRSFDVFLQDLDRFRREVQGLVPVELPLFLIGHSLGGLIALRYLEEYDTPFRGSVLTAPWLGTTVDMPRFQVVVAGILDRLLPAFPFPYKIDPSILSHDQGRVEDYRADPLIHSTITPRLFTQSSSAIELALRRGDRIDLPVLFLLAGDDAVVDTDRSLTFARSLPSDTVTIDVLEGYFHEVLPEQGRGAVMAEIRDWIQDHME
jgi:alpha-beta hydrolase superfamily lysophospholipase